ncbi:hypothetical protein ACJX0J_031214, partial [Zea mays]
KQNEILFSIINSIGDKTGHRKIVQDEAYIDYQNVTMQSLQTHDHYIFLYWSILDLFLLNIYDAKKIKIVTDMGRGGGGGGGLKKRELLGQKEWGPEQLWLWCYDSGCIHDGSEQTTKRIPNIISAFEENFILERERERDGRWL